MTVDDLLLGIRRPLIALGIVVALSFGMLAVDYFVARDTAVRTTDLVHNAMRSVALVGELRGHAHEPDEVAAVEQIAALYDPLATYPGERDEWAHLQALIASRAPMSDIETSIDRIVQINQIEAERAVSDIDHAHDQNLIIDASVGGLTLVLASIVAAALVRSLRHRRALVEAQLAVIADRQRELEAFAGRVAHNLRGPLQPIRGYADMLRLGCGPATGEIGERLGRSSERLAEIVDELLELSISGRARPGIAEVAPVVAEVVDELRPVLGEARLEVAVERCTAGCSTSALDQILRNLVSNAAKYRSPERPLVVSIAATTSAVGMVELVVADNGVGMDTATAQQAFEPWFRGSATRKIPGHGLGLSIVKRTIDSLGGTCRIDSRPGAGTRFVVRLPAAA